MSEQDFLAEAAELIKSIEEAKTQNFIDLAHLADIDIRQDLAGQNLSRMSFQGANLSESDLSNTDLSHSDLRDADLRKSNLQKTNLRYAIVANAVFENCDGIEERTKENLKRRGALFSSELYYTALVVQRSLEGASQYGFLS